MIRARRLAAVLAGAALLAGGALLAGCSGPGDPAGSGAGGARAGEAGAAAGAPPPFADCAALTAPPGAAAPGRTAPGPTAPGPASPAAAAPGAAPPGPVALPDLTLPCFTGGRTLNMGQIRGPAMINLWASWCAPCRAELPALQRYAERARGRVHVIGVVSNDDREAATSLARELGVTFPAIFDREAFLLGRVRRVALPVTVFVDAQGRIVFTYNSEPLDGAAIAALAHRHLGVAVPS